MPKYKDVLEKIIEERRRIWLGSPSYVKEIRKRGFSNIMFARTIAFLISNSLERLVRGIRVNILMFEDAKRFVEWNLEEFAKILEGHMFLYKNLKPEFKENVPVQIFREAALVINDLKTTEELLTLLEELQRYIHKVYDWIDWSIPWFKLEEELKDFMTNE